MSPLTPRPRRAGRALLALAVAAGGAAAVVPMTTAATAATAPVAGVSQAPGTTPADPVAVGVIVTYRSSAPEASSIAAARSDASAKTSASRKDVRRMAQGRVVVPLDDAAAIEDAIDAYGSDPTVVAVEPDLLLQPFTNDPGYPQQWDLFEPTGGMNVEDAWAYGTGAGVTVSVIDTGYVAHSDLSGQVIPGYDFIASTSISNDGDGRDADASDPGDWNTFLQCGLLAPDARNSSWHGTHVAGTIAAATDNGNGIAGIAHDAKIQPVRVLGRCGGATSDIVDAITWSSGGAVPGVPANPTPADVINMSLGGTSSCTSTYQTAIDAAVSRGTVVVVAAGNSDSDVSGFVPASCNNVISVASNNRSGGRSWYSNYGSLIDIAAPGGETRTEDSVQTPQNGIWSTLNAGTQGPAGETIAPYMGTSMAAPHIAGLAALMRGIDGSLTPAEIESLIEASARPLAVSCPEGCGAGIADAAATLAALDGDPQPAALAAVNPGARTATVGQPMSLQLTATGGSAPYSWSATGLPAGLSISGSGLISGTPTAAGSSTVVAAVTDAGNDTDSVSFALTVEGSTPEPTCADADLTYTGSLASGGARNHATFTVSSAGTIDVCLDGPDGADFDVYLQTPGLLGLYWTTVASGITPQPDEAFSVNVSAGTYRLRIVSDSGAGAYTAGVSD